MRFEVFGVLRLRRLSRNRKGENSGRRLAPGTRGSLFLFQVPPGRPLQNRSTGRKAAAMARAVPGLFNRIPLNDASKMGADGGAFVQRA